ncbi:hypothetical protein [Cupriavidus basilensis]|uniref:hypothetical protein n=1 Tax=Cupriavidus basilensis TaxID=68895 RepID=UPI00283C3C2D|nr:hypothetical protein [Cupriavidus basilensis]MDR3381753.1 hypothetical protein [Cupriavidus basilensis]
MLNINGHAYMGPGLGLTSAGTPAKTQFSLMHIHRAVDVLADDVIEDPNGQFAEHTRRFNITDAQYEFVLTPRGLAVYEKESQTAFVLPRVRDGSEQASVLEALHETVLPEWAFASLKEPDTLS